MSGATVSIVSGKVRKSIATNASGEFILPDMPKGKYIVEISFVGFETFRREITIGDDAYELSAILKQALGGLDQVQVIAYGTTTKRLNTGNVTTVKGEDIQKQPVSDPIMALEGRVPGLYISQASGIPGAGLTVKLRGQNSIANGNNPFYIVDGVPFTSNTLTSYDISGGALSNGTPGNGMSPFNNLNPADIESIEVLKDADATAIYGSRGSNGVILITTKKGKAGVTKFDLNAYMGAGRVATKMTLLNTQEYLKMRHESLNNDNLTPGQSDFDVNGEWDSTRYTDWQKLMIGGSAKYTGMQGTLSGGNSNTQFIIGGGFSKQTTVFPGNYSDRKASVHLNLTHSSSDQKLHALFSAIYVSDNSNMPGSDFTQFITYAPNAPAIFAPNGNLNWQNDTWLNPYAELLQHAKAVTNNLISNFNISYELFPGLQIRNNAGFTHIQMNQNNIIPLTYYDPSIGNDPLLRQNNFATSDIKTWIIEPQLNYSKKLGEGKLDILIGSTFQENVQSTIGQYASGFPSDALISNIAAASSILIAGNSYNLYHYNALFGRVNYIFNNKLIFNLTGRRDGSSRFGPGKQFGNFGAIGAGWIFSKEKFIQNSLPYLSFGKLRGSYGTTGNDQLGDYQYLSTYSTTNVPYQGLTGLLPSGLTNPNFAWEVVKKMEAGIELGFFNDRIFLSTSYYRNRTGNQLVGYSLPSTSGFSSVQANLPAIIQNSGLEFVLNTVNIKTKNFSWNTFFNLSIPQNRLIAYPNLSSSSYQYKYAIGQPLFVVFAAHNTGVDPQTGVYQFEDVQHSGNTLKPSNPQDYRFIKSVAQKFYGGLQNSISYKGFELDFFFQFVKQSGYNYTNLFNRYSPGSFDATDPRAQNLPAYFLGRWQKAGDLSSIQKFTSNRVDAGDAGISDASYVRLKNVYFSYSLSSNWQKKIHLQSAKIYLQAQNIFTNTQYKGLDPETQTLSLPPLKMVTVGIQIGL